MSTGIVSTNPMAPAICTTEFNVVTNLLDDITLKKREQESIDISKYRFDLRPGPMCYMDTQTFQGYQIEGDKRVPPALLDVETYLREAPLITRTEIDSVRDKEPPPMPPILSNRLIVPDCRDILKTQETKNWKRTDQPQFDFRNDYLVQVQHNDYMRPGRDTRQEMRDAYKIWESKRKGVYGIGKYDKSALKPVVDVPCDDTNGELPCIHVAPSGAPLQGPVLDPSLNLGQIATLSSTADSGVNLGGPEGGGVNVIASSGAPVPPGGIIPTKTYSAETVAAAESLDSNKSYMSQLVDIMQKQGCQAAKFYGYQGGGC